MEIPITQFRRELFSLVDQALEGRELWIRHKGRRLRVVAETAPASRLSRITPLNLEAGQGVDPNDPALRAELHGPMRAAWEKDWEGQ